MEEPTDRNAALGCALADLDATVLRRVDRRKPKEAEGSRAGAATYSSGLRAPALIAFVKDTLIYIVIAVAI
ncbi:hypothetical protein ACWD4F_34620, partial [Streptomyces aureus]